MAQQKKIPLPNRKLLRVYTLAALFVLATSIASPAQRRSDNPCPKPARDYWRPDGVAGDLQFDIPAGWEKINDQGATELVPSMQSGKSLTRIGFLAPTTLNGNTRQYFESVWAQWRKRMNMIDNGDPEVSHTSRGFELISRYSRVYAPSIGDGTFHLALAVIGNRAQAYFFLDNTGNVDYDEAFRTFEHSVQFANAAKPELPEPGLPCGMNGIYVGWKRTAGLRGGIVSEAVMTIETLVFFPDGNVLRHMPEKGLKDFDFGKEIKESRIDCGRYRMVGDQVRITWSDDTKAVGNRDGEKLSIEDWPYTPAGNSDGLRLNATYRTEFPTSGPRIRFSPDGHFVENGILDSIDYHGSDRSAGRGTYSIEKNTIELHYSSGHYVPLSFIVFASDLTKPRLKQIHINSKSFVITE